MYWIELYNLKIINLKYKSNKKFLRFPFLEKTIIFQS